MRRALLSVTDKHGITEFARGLVEAGFALLSTGGTRREIADGGVAVEEVADYTGFPEMMDGRVKTLHPKVHGGLLARRDDDAHLGAMKEHGIDAIDLLCVNLYRFRETVRRPGISRNEIVENIDIGGPAMIRSAAKNHQSVAVVVDPGDYPEVLRLLKEHEGALPQEFLRKLAAKAYAHTASYDAAIAQWFDGERRAMPGEPFFAQNVAYAAAKVADLRYGENPHQSAAFYRDARPAEGTLAGWKQLQGKELSYNNINDTDAAFELVSEFLPGDGPACAIIKHANPCGVAKGATLLEAYKAAFDCDRTSAFGGIVAFNRPLDEETAREITGIFTEVVIAPGASDGAMRIFKEKKNLRLLTTEGLPDVRAGGQTLRQVAGGFLMQDKDVGFVGLDDLKVVTKVAPTDEQMRDLLFAWKVAKHVKSNAIVYVKDGATVGVGAGQMSRV
ncbi:MAG: bifunctional phosphoribosylaminoimidazolecarboxamide formyltransferase/IMP cyclohydrolase, partial [Planctomycetes bacterium]|nr:bifunctional phosphoribosylaminoimidazolecarboxamide formyltransferase/IMP cyclohydrolase [Planctomycetota bacterium]